MEIVLVVCAWLSNGRANESMVARRVIEVEMGGKPHEYMSSYVAMYPLNTSLHGIMTHSCYDSLIARMCELTKHGKLTLENVFDKCLSAKGSKFRYPHEVLVSMFSRHTGFPTKESRGTFYRLNLLYHWLTCKYGVWSGKNLVPLLPCNDNTFHMAKEMGLTKTQLNSSLQSVVRLSTIVAKRYESDGIAKAHELLNERNHD